MTNKLTASRNWFDQGGEAYAHFRPGYPDQLSEFLPSIVPDNSHALDVGCGTGQLTCKLASYFDHVVGLDSSRDQIANAVRHDRVQYQCASAEKLPLHDKSVTLVTVAQAAHWFNLPDFYEEIRRVSVTGGVLALISYAVPRLESEIEERFSHFYKHEIGPYWPPERKLVDTGYADIDFPFCELYKPTISINLEWSQPQLFGYISTWSAVRRAREAGKEELLIRFFEAIERSWGEPETLRSISWPINMRIGKI